MPGEHTTPDGYKLTTFSAAYMDWGLRIEDSDGKEVFYNPHYLSNDSYGRKPHPDKYEDWEDAERAAMDGDGNAFVPWDTNDWNECLREQADLLLEGALGPEWLETVG